jgi:hypothetical protein
MIVDNDAPSRTENEIRIRNTEQECGRISNHGRSVQIEERDNDRQTAVGILMLRR